MAANVLYPALRHPAIAADVINYIAALLEGDPESARSIEDCLYYTFYREAGYIVVSVLYNQNDINFLVRIEDPQIYIVHNNGCKEYLTVNEFDEYEFRFNDSECPIFDLSLTIKRTIFEEVIKEFKRNAAPRCRNPFIESFVSQLLHTRRMFAAEDRKCRFFPVIGYGVDIKSVLTKNDYVIFDYISSPSINSDRISLNLYCKFARFIRTLLILNPNANVCYRLPPIDESGNFVVEATFTNEFLIISGPRRKIFTHIAEMYNIEDIKAALREYR